MDELKPCPFCGGNAELIVNCDSEGYQYWLCVCCDSCHGCVNGEWTETKEKLSEFTADEKQEIITAWNTRTQN